MYFVHFQRVYTACVCVNFKRRWDVASQNQKKETAIKCEMGRWIKRPDESE